MKKIKTQLRKELVMKLNSIDSKLKFKNSQWEQEVKIAFNSTGSFCFENLVYTNYSCAEALYLKFK